ncbi:MAG TPA: tetratricopeptide repeat protein [Pirellulales bacterium]|jgi:tetratricopeptide (TPR) repeat protein|nr:tetratricopeptide repeat protein [Pirellulales bacterium]
MSQTLIQSPPFTQHDRERRADGRRAFAVCGLLVLVVVILFGRTLRQGFSGYDDDIYVYNEPHVTGGLSWSGVVWAFTDGPYGERYPLSMLSHMLDSTLYGVNPAGHHLTNLVLHAASTVLLFLVLWRMTGGLWPSAMVAALFALHPLHVEPVAWVAARRDTLSGLLFVLTLGAYGEYVRHTRSLWRYLAVVGLFALGLLAKPMLVTLPPLLLLLDYWPLGRFGRIQPDAEAAARTARNPWRLVLEKLPLLALALAMAALTMRTHTVHPDALTLSERSAGAVVSCVAYLGQLFVPVGLSVFYCQPVAGRPAWQVAAGLALLLAITVAAVIGRRRYPYFFVGWFWYLGMLVPVLGIVFVGPQSRADRYSYLSQIGLYIALVWGAMRLGASLPARRWVFGIGSALVLAALMACSWRQLDYWQTDLALWEHALALDSKNIKAHYMLGAALEAKDEARAVAQYRQAVELGPNERDVYPWFRTLAQNSLGNIADRKGDDADAVAHYGQALELDSSFSPAEVNLGRVLVKQGKLDEAMAHFQRSIELAPHDAIPLVCMADVQSKQGKTDEAIANYRQAVKVDPNFDTAHWRLAASLAARGDIDGAIVHFRRVIELDPDVAYPYGQMAELLRKQGKSSEAAKYEERGRKVSRRYAEAQNLRGTELAKEGKINEAIAQFQIAIVVFPDYTEAHNNLAHALTSQGNIDGAVAHYRRALEIDPNYAPAKKGLEQLSNR